ncbi:hypothetical protein J3F83DRAFT_203610 [Trichoderma novae-zelandiae]
MVMKYRFRQDFVDHINDMDASKDNDSSMKESSGREESASEASPPRPWPRTRQSLDGIHLPFREDSQPNCDLDSGEEGDDEEDQFADFVGEFCVINEDDEAGMKDVQTALEYLRGVLAAARNEEASCPKAVRKTGDENSVHGKDCEMDEEDDFVLIDGEEETGMTESRLEHINHLDYVMFPTVNGVDVLREGEMEVLGLDDHNDADANGSGNGAASSSAPSQSSRQLFYQEFYDQDHKVFQKADLEAWRREVAQACGGSCART